MLQRIDIQIYRSQNGKLPFSDWLHKLDKATQAIIDTRLARVRGGNFGDFKRLRNAESLLELRINFGPGYRVYCGMHSNKIVILLCAGDKRSQERDIRKARDYWKHYLSQVGNKE